MGISHSSSALLENLSQNFKALLMLNSDEHEIKTVPKYRDQKTIEILGINYQSWSFILLKIYK